METTGVWSFEYFTEKGLEDWILRRKIAEKMLGWKFEEASFDEGTGGSSQHSACAVCCLHCLCLPCLCLCCCHSLPSVPYFDNISLLAITPCLCRWDTGTPRRAKENPPVGVHHSEQRSDCRMKGGLCIWSICNNQTPGNHAVMQWIGVVVHMSLLSKTKTKRSNVYLY